MEFTEFRNNKELYTDLFINTHFPTFNVEWQSTLNR